MKNYIQKIINSFTSSEHSEEVTTEVHQWLLNEEHADEKQAALRTLWDETQGNVEASAWNSLSSVYDKIGINKHKKPQPLFIRIWKYAAVAVIAIAVSLSGAFIFTNDMHTEIAMVEKFTSAGNMDIIELPDGSKVQTNSGTMLLYPEKFKGDTRTVYLIGEANFKVMQNPDKPFIVKSATVAVTALGTEFNVSAYPENQDIVATLIQGKIKVDCGEEDSYILTPGQQVTYTKSIKESLLADADLEDVTAWQKGLNVFRGKTMGEILSVLERRFSITFQYNASQFNEDKYNFSFRKNSDINEIMEVMKEVVKGFDYRINDDVCYIRFKR